MKQFAHNEKSCPEGENILYFSRLPAGPCQEGGANAYTLYAQGRDLNRSSTDFPKTSQPSPQDFVNAYTPFIEKNEPILSIHISSELSGTYQSACLARTHFPDARIEVVDSHQASIGLALILRLCSEKARSGLYF